MEERRQILELIEAGEISVEEGVRRLEALEGSAEVPEEMTPAPDVPIARPRLVRILWQAMFWLGVALVVGGGLLVAAVYAWGVASGWLICGWPLFGLGVLVVALGWWMRRARWFSLRVRQSDGPNVSFALPLGPIAWMLRFLRPFVPQLKETGVDELIMSLHEEVRDGQPFIVEVDEGEDGEQVQVYFG